MKDSCKITDKKSACCCTPKATPKVNSQVHWNQTYLKSPQEKLGWYETDLTPSLKLIDKAGLDKKAHLLIVGAGSTTLVDALIEQDYTHLTATDISTVALDNLAKRVDNQSVSCVVDDLIAPKELAQIAPVDLWMDRAVLHFFTEKGEQDAYFDLLKDKVKSGGYVLLAQFRKGGATRCSGFPVLRYDLEMYQTQLGPNFELVDSFDYDYTMPSGDNRPYVYGLYRRRA